ncbi:MAG: glycine cleavage system protein H [Candidatus Freyrarchaeum guaymaensis]
MEITFELEGESVTVNLPDDLYYHNDHCWVRVENGKARIGFDDFGQATAGKILFVRLKPEGKTIEAGKSFGSIETGKWVGPLRAPISGTILEVNPEVKKKPTIINEDPYGDGWLIVVEPTNLEPELANLVTGDAIKAWIDKEIEERLK